MKSLIKFLAGFVVVYTFLVYIPSNKAADTYEQITTLSSATALTIPDSDFQPFTGCVIHAEGGNIRWRNDGTSPSTTVGNLIYDTGFMVVGDRLSDVEVIEVTGSTKANVYYFKNPLPMGTSAPGGSAIASVGLDDAYNNGSSITVDASDVIWNLSSTYDFHIQDAGSAVFTVTDGGDVGIGASAPTAKLEVSDTLPIFSLRNDSASISANEELGEIVFRGDDTNVNDERVAYIKAYSETDWAGTWYADANLRFYTKESQDGVNQALERMRIASTGDVGINQASPNEKLEVDGNIRLTSDADVIQFGAAQDYTIQWDGDDAVHTISAGDFVLTGGNVGLGLATPQTLLSLNSVNNTFSDLTWVEGSTIRGRIRYYNHETTDATDAIRFGAGTVMDIMVIQGSSKIGILTTGPDATLEVAGDLQVGDGDTDTNYMSVSATGDQTFTGSAGFYPHVLSQDGEPAAGTGATQVDAGELMVWIDTNDSNKVYLVYNNGGTVVIELME